MTHNTAYSLRSVYLSSNTFHFGVHVTQCLSVVADFVLAVNEHRGRSCGCINNEYILKVCAFHSETKLMYTFPFLIIY